MRATNFENDPYKIIKGTWVRVGAATTDIYPYKVPISTQKKLKNLKNKNFFIDVLWRLKSDH